MEDLMRHYLNPRDPGSLGGVKRFHQQIQDHVPDQKNAQAMLEETDPYTINKETRKKFRRNPIVVISLRQQFQADLADVKKYAQQNNGTQYLLVVVDCFSRLASVQPLKDKTAKSLHQGLRKVFRDLGVPDKLQTDKGTEFLNTVVQKYLQDNEVHHFTSENSDVKCAMAERLIRTIKSRIWRLFRHRVATRYIDKLQDIVYAYNNSVHSAHGLRPVDVTDKNSLHVFHQLTKSYKAKSPRYSVGQFVRLAKDKSKLEKGYEYRFTEEIFKIIQVIRHSVPVYRLEDLTGGSIKGTFYEPELSLVRNFENREHQIDRVLRRKGNKLFVRWLGYGPEHDSWIDKSCMKTNPST
jgi:Integrase core domain